MQYRKIASAIGIAAAFACHMPQASANSGTVDHVLAPGGSSTSPDSKPCAFFESGGVWLTIPYAAIGASTQILLVMEARQKGWVINWNEEPGLPGCDGTTIAEDIWY